MKLLKRFYLTLGTAALLGALAASNAQAAACKVYLHGSDGPAFTALKDDGVTVHAPGNRNLEPYWRDQIPEYDAIWFQYDLQNHADVKQLLLDFAASGKGIHLTMDYDYSYVSLDILKTRLAASVGGQDQGLGITSSASNYTYNANALADLTRQPFVNTPPATTLASGGDLGMVLAGPIPARNRLAEADDLTAPETDSTALAAFDTDDMVDGKGRLSFFGNSGQVGMADQQGDLMLVLRNIQAFLLKDRPCQAPLEAFPDTGEVTSATGGQAVANVLSNDFITRDYYTVRATDAPYNLRLSEVPGTNTSPASHPITLDTTTGAINVLPGTPAGDYELEYQFCQISNPGNCVTTKVNIKVTAGAPTQLALTQAANQHPVGATHTATATVQDSAGNPIAGAPVTFTVTSGPNAGQTQVVNADAQGVATFSYTGAAQGGTDVITATTPSGSSTLQATPLQVNWLIATSLVLSQPTSTHEVGQTHTASATVTDNQGTPMAGVAVTFTVTAGPNAGQTVTATTNAQGLAQWQYQGGSTAGVDTISATMPAGASTVTSNTLQVTWTEASTPPVNPPTTATPTPVPTLSGWALLALSSLLAALAGLRQRKAGA